MTYKLLKNQYTGTVTSVQKTLDGIISSIPFDLENTDYQEYLAWVEEGNTPEEAD